MKGEDKCREQCRLCGNSSEETLNLFDKNISKINLVNVVNDTLHLTVKESDSLPKKICVTCKKIVEEFERFRQSCILAEKSFKSSSDHDSNLTEPECTLNDEQHPVVTEEESSSLETTVQPDLNLERIKVEVMDEGELLDCSDGTHLSFDENEFDEAVLKEPHKDDYILVKQDRFTLDESARRLQNNYVEYCKPGIMPSDRLLVENVKKRQALPEMWDVYEMESQDNMTKVTMRRYIISKEAFPCSLCNKCISVKSDTDPQEEENWDSSFEFQGHTEGVIDEMFEKSNLSESQGHKAGKKCSVSPSCEICKKSFNRAQSLKRHYRTHYGYERLPCEVCGKGFSRKEHLARHMILHTGGRPFECISCKKRFTRKEHLNRHIQLHEERDCLERPIGHLEEFSVDYEKPVKKKRKSYECRPKPHSCDICGAGFGQKEHLIKHLRRMHNRDYDSCPETRVSSISCKEENTVSSAYGEEKLDSDPVPSPSPSPSPAPAPAPSQSPPLASPTASSLAAALALKQVQAPGSMSAPAPVSSPTPAPSPASTHSLELPPTRTEKNLLLCELCPRSFSRTEQLGRHLKIHRRDSMFVNESRVPGTDITFSFTNSSD